MDSSKLKSLLQQSFDAAVAAADPRKIVAAHLPTPPSKGRTLVVGAGKAAASMAAAVESAWPEHAALTGIVITRYAHGLPLKRIRCIEAGHPVPDQAGERAAQEILDEVMRLGPQDQLIVLVSGGGSSLLSLPAETIPMADLKSLTQALLNSGAPITEMNTVRKHLSRIQGGRLALASKAPVLALVISDVVGDDPSAIASGPCTADPTSFQDAADVLKRWSITPSASIAAHLQAGLSGAISETPKPGDARLGHAKTIVIATARESLQAASQVFTEAGFQTIMLGDAVTGEARDVAQVMASWARELALFTQPRPSTPVVLISGGECTVTVRGNGRGGRCVEFLLAFAHACDELGISGRVAGVAADTDGIDGVSPHAGGILLPDTIQRAQDKRLGLRMLLDNNDGLGLFEPLGDVITTGATLTNVNDYRALVVMP
ncbi:MAG: glycerate kinase [Betaproteobacteria bacterium]|nr:glycerate kinase [Betaproteobacteria bacterium]